MPRPLTDNPVSAWGVTSPSSVVNTMSTTASSGNGLKRVMTSIASLVVMPSAKYQLVEALDAQGVTVSPREPLAAWSTTASPPSNSTSAEAKGATTTSFRRTMARPAGSTERGTCLVSPSLGMTVTMPLSWRLPALATTTLPLAVPSAADVVPVQNQADERAPGRAPIGVWTSADSRVVGRWTRRSRTQAATRTTTMATTAGARRGRFIDGRGLPHAPLSVAGR
jgi:hypothetical protein